MYTILQIADDPTAWHAPAGYSLTVSQLSQARQPLAVPVTSPVRGTLLLSPRGLRAIAVTEPDPGHEGMPSDASVQVPQVYLPSATGMTINWSGYQLSGTLADAQDRITRAMRDGTIVSVAVTGGQVVLNGATLAFAVLCEPSVPAT